MKDTYHYDGPTPWKNEYRSSQIHIFAIFQINGAIHKSFLIIPKHYEIRSFCSV